MARSRRNPRKPLYNKELAKMFDASDAAAYKKSALQPYVTALKKAKNTFKQEQPSHTGPGRTTPITSGLNLAEMASRTRQNNILEQKKYEALSSVYSGPGAQHHSVPDWMNRTDNNPWVLKSANKLQISEYQKNLQNMYGLSKNNRNKPTGGSGKKRMV